MEVMLKPQLQTVSVSNVLRQLLRTGPQVIQHVGGREAGGMERWEMMEGGEWRVGNDG